MRVDPKDSWETHLFSFSELCVETDSNPDTTLMSCHPQERKLSQSHSEYHYLEKGPVPSKGGEVLGHRVKKDRMPTLCPAIRSLPFMRYLMTPQKLCRETASPDVGHNDLVWWSPGPEQPVSSPTSSLHLSV